MASMLIQHKVKDFATWKKVFDSKFDLRKTNGEISHKIFQDASDPNLITVFNEWNSLENAQKFAHSPELRSGMAEAGVEGIPTVTFLNEA